MSDLTTDVVREQIAGFLIEKGWKITNDRPRVYEAPDGSRFLVSIMSLGTIFEEETITEDDTGRKE